MTDKTIQQKRTNKHIETKNIISAVVMVSMGILMTVQLLILLVPLVWAVMASFKDTYDFSVSPFTFPDIFRWQNYVRAFKGLEVEYWNDKTQTLVSYNFFNMFVNSAIYSLASPAWSLFVTFCTAYLLARYRFWGSKAF